MAHNILIVDDEINTLKVLSAALQNSRTHVETAQSGEEALDLIKKKKYNLVVSDFKMGGMSGEDLLEKAKTEVLLTIKNKKGTHNQSYN